MMKWLRQHTKQIMVVVVLLAMFSFVGGSALVSIMRPKNDGTPRVQMFGEELATSDLLASQQETSILERLGLNWKFGGPKTGVVHWYMITREAAEAGIEVSDEEIDRNLEAMAGSGLTPARLERIRRDGNFSELDLKRTLAKYIAVSKNARRVQMAAMPSEAEVKHFVRDTNDKMSIRFATLDAARFVDKDAPISEAELQAQFDKYKDIFPADSDDGFGYKYEDRVKIQYVIADLAVLKSMIDVDFEEEKNYWKSNKDKYKITEHLPQETPATTQPAEPVKPKTVERMKTFSEARKDVEKDIREGKAKSKAGQAMNKVTSELLSPWFAKEPDPKTGFKEIPDEVKQADYMKNISQRVSRELDVPLEYGESELMSLTALSSFRRIGAARTLARESADSLTLAQMAFNNPVFMEPREARESTHKLQLFQTPDSHLTAGNKYVLFRVVEAVPEAAPESLDEVRAQVEKDVRLKKAYDSIEPLAEELYAVSLRLGLAEALKQFDDLRKDMRLKGPDVAGPFPRREDALAQYRQYGRQLQLPPVELTPPAVRGVGKSASFVDACFEMIEDGWQAPQPTVQDGERIAAASTQPALPETPAVRVFALPSQHKWFVIEKLNTEFVNESQYEGTQNEGSLKDYAFSILLDSRSRVLQAEWFSLENIEKRCGYHRLSDDEMPQSIEGFESQEMPMPPQF